MNAFRHHFRLCQADVITKGMDLTVGIGDANVIHINQRDCANTGSRQRLCRPRPHTTNAHDADMRIRKQLQGFFTIETCRAAKTLTPGIADYHRHKTSDVKRVRFFLTLNK